VAMSGSRSTEETVVTPSSPVNPSSSLYFQLNDALSLQAYDDLVTQSPIAARGFVDNILYRLFPSLQRKLYRRTGSTNLMAVKESGESQPAFESDYPVKVLYTAIDPTASHVYVVLDTDNSSTLVADENCALFRVSISDNSSHCVENGLYLRSDLDSFREKLGDERKPIQFDGEGNAWFAAQPFTINGGGDSTTISKTSGWKPLIYRHNPNNNTTTAITNDAQQINFFLVLEHGELIYQGTNGITQESKMWLYRNGESITIGDRLPSYLSTDHYRTAFWIENSKLNLVRSRDTGGVYRAFLPLEQTPASTFLGDDGTLYGMNISSSRVTVRSILPHKVDPVATINFQGQRRRTVPVRISERSIYYTDQQDVEFYGEVTVVKISNLLNGETQTLFDDRRYDIYAWQLSGRKLYFSGVDLGTTSLVSGIIDTNKVGLGLPTEQYLTINSVESAIDAANEINDIEILLPKRPTSDPGGAPEVDEMNFSSDRGDVVSLFFNKYMNYSSVEQQLKLSGHGGEISYIPLWFHRTLHLVPDTDGLGDQDQTTPLNPEGLYQLSLGEGASVEGEETPTPTLNLVVDSYDNPMQPALNEFSGEVEPYLSWFTRQLQQAGGARPLFLMQVWIPSDPPLPIDRVALHIPNQHRSLPLLQRLPDYRAVVGSTLRFTLEGIDSSGKTVRWDFGDGNAPLVGTTAEGVSFGEAGRYNITITIETEGATTTERRTIEVVESSEITLPTALTLHWGEVAQSLPQIELFIPAQRAERQPAIITDITAP